MNIDGRTLEKVKTNLRIKHSLLDEDLVDTISACLSDLDTCGVYADQYDPLVLNAVKLYCRATYTDDTGKAEAYMNRYDALKACLMMAGRYRHE